MCVCVCVGGGGLLEDTQELPYFIHKTHCHDLFYGTYSFMKIFLLAFKTEGVVALTIKGR